MGRERFGGPPSMMKYNLNNMPVNWVDLLAAAVLVIGFIRGRKRGLSQELLDTTQWVLIIVTGAIYYRPLAALMAQKPMFSQLTYFILSYLLIALGWKIVFTFIKQRIGQKLIEGDVFGRFEFYGGMLAGTVRFACVFFFVISLLHAPYYSPEYWTKRAKEVDYNYGSDFFPAPCKIQKWVYKESVTGRSTEHYASQFIIVQVAGEDKKVRDENSLARRNERKIDALMGGK